MTHPAELPSAMALTPPGCKSADLCGPTNSSPSEKSLSPEGASLSKFPEHMTRIYEVGAMLGQGGLSTVWRCVHRPSGQVRVVKKIDTSESSPRQIAHEIALMRLLKHEHVVKCYDVFLEAKFVNVVVDIFTGGDLIECLEIHQNARGRVPDGQLANLLRQMVAAIVHVHGLQVVHRDIKGEHFLADRPDIGDPECRVALTDFGAALRIEHGQEDVSGAVGTQAFWAPEMFRPGRYDFRVDVWALGVTAFVLLAGALPFEGEEQICEPVAFGELPFTAPDFATGRSVDFIAACLAKDPRSRPQATAVAQHPWLTTPTPGAGSQAAPVPRRSDPNVATVSHGAVSCFGAVVDVLGAVIGACCGCFSFCLDLVLSSDTEESRKPGEERQKPGDGSAKNAALDQDNLQEHVTASDRRTPSPAA